MTKNNQWLVLTVEDTLEPNLPICDSHHLWFCQKHRVYPQYLLNDFLGDIDSGHTIVAPVFIECGETEFANGIAANSASGGFGPCRVASGIVGTANFLLAIGLSQFGKHNLTREGRGLKGATWSVLGCR